MTPNLNHHELTERIIGAAIEVHRHLGPGFLEAIYEEALSVELKLCNLAFERQKKVFIMFKGRSVGEHRLDLLVEGLVVVEIKAVREIDPVFFAVARSYLHATGLTTALLFNFAAFPLSIKRVGVEPLRSTPSSSALPETPPAHC